MDDEIEEVKQDIKKVEQRILDVERELKKKSARKAAVAHLLKEKKQLRGKELQLRKEKEQLREKKLLLLRAGISELGSEMKLADDHPMSKFVDCLKKTSMQGSINDAKLDSVVKLLEGVVWLGDKSTFSNQLFLRPCYFELLEAKDEYFKLNRKLITIVYTETPGIGKLHLCAYVIARKLIAGTAVFFEVVPSSNMKRERTEFYSLDLANGVRKLELFQVLHQLPADAVCIIDGGPLSSTCPIVDVQIFANPLKALYVAKTKSWDYLFLHTLLLSLEEMHSCRSAISDFATKVTKETMEDWFFVAGGVARAVLKESSVGAVLASWMDEARKQITSVDLNGLKNMIAGLQRATFAPGSDSLFHWRVDEKNVQLSTTGSSPKKKFLRRFRRKMLCFASNWVTKQFYLKMHLEKILGVVSFILSCTGDVEISTLRGYWFETVSHMILSTGGMFACRWLDTSELFKLTLPQAELRTFKGIANASSTVEDDLSVYCLPVASNQVAIDSVSSPYLFFQMTSSAKHTINEAGLSSFLKALNGGGWFTQETQDFV